MLNAFIIDMEENMEELLEAWDKRRKMAIAIAIGYITHTFILSTCATLPNYIDRTPLESESERASIRDTMLQLFTKHPSVCRHMTRMSTEAFAKLVQILKGRGLLRDSRRSSVEEQVAKFLFVVGHNIRNRTNGGIFRRSPETNSRHFHNVLEAIIMLEDIFLIQPDGSSVPPEIQNSHRFSPYFKVINL